MDYVVDLVLKPLFEYAGAIAWFVLLAVIGAIGWYLFEKFLDTRGGTKLYRAYRKLPHWLRGLFPAIWGIGITVFLFWLYATL